MPSVKHLAILIGLRIRRPQERSIGIEDLRTHRTTQEKAKPDSLVCEIVANAAVKLRTSISQDHVILYVDNTITIHILVANRSGDTCARRQ